MDFNSPTRAGQTEGQDAKNIATTTGLPASAENVTELPWSSWKWRGSWYSEAELTADVPLSLWQQLRASTRVACRVMLRRETGIRRRRESEFMMENQGPTSLAQRKPRDDTVSRAFRELRRAMRMKAA